MAINIKFDTAGNPEPPSIILATKNGNKLGLLNVNVDSIELKDKLKISEISFTLNKYVDGELNNLWDKVVDFKLVWCKEWDCWFEIKVELDEATETVKTVFGTQLGQAELSQIMVYNMEVNTEEDIVRDDYKITILYDENDHKASLLHRIFKDKAPHYSIAYVDPTIARIQRQFSWDGSSICDVLDEVEEEIGCLVVYNSNSTKGGMPNRSISVYDLEQNCNDCGYRGEFTGECPKCGSKNINYGYGEDTTIFVTNDELASKGIQLVADIDSVKNCFKLEAGDDLMTATIRNCNPNGSDYIWRFSNDIKEDMSDELVEKLKSYDAEYKRYYNEHESNLDATLLTQYNNLVEKYDDFYNTDSTCLNCDNEGAFYDKCPSCNSENLLTGKELRKISTPIVGYSSLMNAYYNTIDFALYLESGLMPSITISDTTAEEQASLLTSSSLSPVAVNVKEVSSISETTADSAVLSMAKVIVKSTYKIEILSSSLSTEKKWSGTFKITNYSDDTDTAEIVVNDIVVNNDVETFIKQKIEKALNKEDTDDYSISGLFEKEYDEFCTELTKYALKPLQSFYDAADACISILTEQGAGDETNKPDLYENLYLPYFQKQEAIASEISIRKNELAIIEGVYDETTKTTSGGLQNNVRNCQSVIQDALNFEDYLGEDLWKEFCSFRREDKYSNSNYISDGLNNALLFERALEFLDVAENEIYKSSELQHSISTSLNNLLAIDKFKPLVKYFKNGNWIRVRVDDKIYKLRLLEYGINFGSFESIPVEFSDVTKIKNGITDVKDVLEQASSVASSYDAVTRQAKKGNVAKGTIEQWIDEGLNAANVQIQSNDSEEVLLTKNGLLARSYDDITGTYSPEQLKITHNIMAYTDDDWRTVRQSIGKHEYKLYDKDENKFVDKIGYGMNADFVTAGVVSGSQIIGGDVYSDNYSVTDATGSYLNLRDGTFSFGGGSLRYENGKLIISSKAADTNITEVNEEWLKTTSVYAENLQVNSAKIQGKLTASQIDVDSLNADDILGETITGKTIKSSNFIGGYLFIGDETKVDDYAEITEDGALTCTNANISGTITGSQIIGNEIEGGTITGSQIIGVDITAGSTLKVGIQKDEDGNEIENSYLTWISEDGVLNTYNANIQGTLTSPTIIGGTIEGSDIIGRSTLKVGAQYDEDGNVTGYLTWISEDGVLNANGANIGGEMHVADNSTIAGFTVTKDKIYNGTFGQNDSVFLSTADMDGVSDFFDGTNIDNWRMTVGSNFGVTSDGSLYANEANIKGDIDAENGKIGQLTISEGALKSSSATGEGFELTISGMKFYDDSACLSFGDSLEITTDSTDTTDLPVVKMNAFGKLEISGNSTSIQLNTETSDATVVKKFKVYANYYEKSGGLLGKNRFVNVWLIDSGENNELLYDQSITFKWFSYIEGDTSCIASGTVDTVWYAAKHATQTQSPNCEQVDIQFTSSDGGAQINFVVQTWINNKLIAVSSFLTSEHSVGDGAFALSDDVYSFEQQQKPNNIIFTGNLIPSVDAEYNLGRVNNMWHTIFCQTSNIDLSDKNLKNNIQSLNGQYSQLFDSLRPVSYKFNDNQSGRTHIGLIAQEVEDGLIQSGLTSQDFAGLCHWDNGDGTKGYGLRYGEFIALCIDQIQKLKQRVAELESKYE